MSELRKGPSYAGYRIKPIKKPVRSAEGNPFSKSMPRIKPHLRYSAPEGVETKVILLNSIIEEHLLKFGLIQSFDTFIREAAEIAAVKGLEKHDTAGEEELKDRLISNFKRGDNKQFQSTWQKLVTRKQLRQPGWKPAVETELKLRAFLALYHLNPHSGSRETDEDVILAESTKRLAEFRAYLDAHAQEFIDNEEFSQYFNIPFALTIDTTENPEFAEFFEARWYKHIEKELKRTAEEMISKVTGDPDERGTPLERMLRFFIKQNAKTNTLEPNNRFEAIEARAEEVSVEIDRIRETNKKRMIEVSNLAYKYESVKDEYESAMLHQEGKYQLEVTPLSCLLLVEAKSKRQAVDEREKKEADAFSVFQKELGRKCSASEARVFKSQYNEKVGGFRLVSFTVGRHADHIVQCEKVWRRLLFEYAQAAHASTKVMREKSLKSADAKVSKEAESKDRPQFGDMTKTLENTRGLLDKDPDALNGLVRSLKIKDVHVFDREYRLDDDFIRSCIEGHVASGQAEAKDDLNKDGIVDEVEKEVADQQEDDGAQAPPHNAKITRRLQYYPEDRRDRTVAALALLNRKLKAEMAYPIPDEELFFAQICKNINEILQAKNLQSLALLRTLHLSACFVYYVCPRSDAARQSAVLVAEQAYALLQREVELHLKSLPAAEAELLCKSTFVFLRLLLNEGKAGDKDILSSVVNLYTNRQTVPIPESLAADSRPLMLACACLSGEELRDMLDMDKNSMVRLLCEDLQSMHSRLMSESACCFVLQLGVSDRLDRYRPLVEGLQRDEDRHVQ